MRVSTILLRWCDTLVWPEADEDVPDLSCKYRFYQMTLVTIRVSRGISRVVMLVRLIVLLARWGLLGCVSLLRVM